MKKYLIPLLFVTGILSLTLMIVAFDRPLRLSNQQPNTQNEDNERSFRMGAVNSMMRGNSQQDRIISTDLTGSDYDKVQLKSALDIVLADEYKARAEYAAIVLKYGQVNPFVQLIQAETRHIESLTRLYKAFDFAILSDNGATFAVVPTSLEAAYQIGSDAETANIAYYETYLNTKLPQSVELIFTHLQNASERHLQIFTDYANGKTEPNSCPMLDRSTQRRGRN